MGVLPVVRMEETGRTSAAASWRKRFMGCAKGVKVNELEKVVVRRRTYLQRRVDNSSKQAEAHKQITLGSDKRT